MQAAAVLLTVAAAAVSRASAGTVACGNWDSNYGATFDIGALQRRGDEMAYIVSDGDIPCTPEVEQNFTYMFNICGSVSGQVPVACSERSAAALQIDERLTPNNPHDDWCKVAGRFDDKTTLELLDPNDPSKGLKMTYYGEPCSHKDKPARKFIIELGCDRTRLSPVPVHAYEYKYCEYTVSMPSVYGCPLECPLANREICGGNGHCSYDTDHRRARCFCNHGYTGADCTQKTSTSDELNYSPALLGLIITLFVVSILLVGLILFMFRQVNAYRQDASNYMALHGGDTDTGV